MEQIQKKWQRNGVIESEGMDCQFIVGKDRTLLTSSRFLLSLASPVFNAMLNSSNCWWEPITIPDANPKVFAKLLRFLQEPITYCSTEEAAEVCLLAHRYKMPDLIRHCSKYLEPKTVNDFWISFDCAVKCDIPSLKNSTMELFRNHSRHILCDQKITSLSSQCMSLIVQEDYMNIESELEVIYAAFSWGKVQCEKRNMTGSSGYIRDVLIHHDILRHLRFLTLTLDEFVKGPAKSGVLTSLEEAEILTNLASDGYAHVQGFLSSNSTHRNPEKRHKVPAVKNLYLRRTSGVRNSEVRVSSPNPAGEINVTSKTQVVVEHFTVTEQCPVVLKAVVLPSQMAPQRRSVFRRLFQNYQEHINVEVYRGAPGLECFENVGKGKCKRNVCYGEEIVIDLEGEESYYEELCGRDSKLKFIITLKCKGIYPLFYNIEGDNVFFPSKEKGLIMKIIHR